MLSHEFPFPGRKGLGSFTGLNSSSIPLMGYLESYLGQVSFHIYKQGSNPGLPRDLEMSVPKQGLCLLIAVALGTHNILCKSSLDSKE